MSPQKRCLHLREAGLAAVIRLVKFAYGVEARSCEIVRTALFPKFDDLQSVSGSNITGSELTLDYAM